MRRREAIQDRLLQGKLLTMKGRKNFRYRGLGLVSLHLHALHGRASVLILLEWNHLTMKGMKGRKNRRCRGLVFTASCSSW